MDDLYFHTLRLPETKCCANCKHIDWRACLVSYADDYYHGYDGTSWCDKCEEGGRDAISAYWRACDAYEEKTADDHIFEMCDHVLYALDQFAEDPKHCKGKTRHEVVRNVLIHYRETITRYLKYDDEKFEFVRRRIAETSPDKATEEKEHKEKTDDSD